jgi:hypothetical protein
MSKRSVLGRFRIALVAGLATLALGAIAVPLSFASNGTTVSSKTTQSSPALDTIPIHGATKSGKQFKGHYAIKRFVAQNGKAYAVGTLRGTLKGRHVTKHNVMMPAKLRGPRSGGAQPAATSCTILRLQLAPIDLNLLGLRVQLFGGTNPANPRPVTLLITAVPGPGNLLGNLLCNLTGALNQPGILTQLNSEASQLAATLTSLISLLGAL